MVSGKKSLSAIPKLPDARGMRFGVVVSEWNNEITESLFQGVLQTLADSGVSENDVIRKNVPGSFELPLGAKFLLEEIKPDAVICIGCVIQGETRHFDFICDAVANGIMRLGLESSVPVIFGVLTTNTMQQAVDRSGGKFGNKGIEAAVTAIQMVALKKNR